MKRSDALKVVEAEVKQLKTANDKLERMHQVLLKEREDYKKVVEASRELEREISSRFGVDYESAPERMSDDLRTVVLPLRTALAAIQKEADDEKK